MQTRSTAEYKGQSIEETLDSLDSRVTGLASDEANQRLSEYGYNEIAEEKHSPVRDFLARYWGPMPWLLELTMLLSFLLSHIVDGLIVFILLTINVIVGFVNSSRSQKALDMLRTRLAGLANVKRDGNWITLEARYIVPGDVLNLTLGELIPADSKIIRGDVAVNQAALTGESLPVHVQESDIVYSGTAVTQGEATCVVVNTGESTFFGATARLVRIAHPESHQTKLVLTIARYLLYFSLLALVVSSVYALFFGADWILLVSLAIIFLMGSIPVALPAVLAVVQAVGSIELSRNGVLVTRLDSIDDAASIDVACIDKTGTITQNKISVADVIAFPRYSKDDVVLNAALASKMGSKDLIDQAVVELAQLNQLYVDYSLQASFTPFSPSLKRSEAIIKQPEGQYKVTKGAVQSLLALSSADDVTTHLIRESANELFRRGYRVLAVAVSTTPNTDVVTIMGLLAISDPIRLDSRDMIEQLRTLGVKPMMLTGDSLLVAKEVAHLSAIGDNVVRIHEIEDTLDARPECVLDYDGFAEIYPEDKYRIVRTLQSAGHMVAMTGDGVNDAPALKQAEMGIAVKNATDVAKASSSMVLTEDGVGVIANAVKTSRKIYQRMLSWVINKLGKTIQVIGVVTLGFFWLQNLAISLIGMVLLVFSNDFATMSLATDNVKSTASPNTWNVKNITYLGLAVGLMLVVQGAITIFIGIEYLHMDIETLQSFVTYMLIFTSQFRVGIVRERNHFWSSRPGNELLVSMAGTLLAFFMLSLSGLIIHSLTFVEAMIALVFSGLYTLILVDPVKYWTARKFNL